MKNALSLSKRDFISMVEDLKMSCDTPEAAAKCELIIKFVSDMHDIRTVRKALISSLNRKGYSADALANAMAGIIL